MIRIAICDDEQNSRVYLKTLIQEQKVACELTEYETGEELLDANKRFDVLFLDIDLKTNISGMDLAKHIRNREGEKQPIIIFVTGYREYVFDAFDVDAFHYLVKPVSKEKFIEVFHKAVRQITEEMEQQKRTIRVQFENSNKVIPIEDILYVESQNHKVILHTKHETIEYYAKISDLEEELKEEFFRIHKGYLINLAYVDKYNKSEVILLSKDILPVSKYKYADFVKAYLHFMEK